MTIVAADSPDVVAIVIDRLRSGQPVVVPTDTVYGVAALPAGVEGLRELKGRPPSRAIPVLVAGAGSLDDLVGHPEPVARRLADAFWPGPLTIVVRGAPGELVDAVSDDGTLGVRCPASDLVRAVAAEVGALPTTSANRHGEPTPATAAAVAEVFGVADLLVVDGGELTGGASTVVRPRSGGVEILRPGPVTAADLAAVAGVAVTET